MRTTVTFKNIDPSDHLRAYVGDKLNRFDKYLANPAEAGVVLSVEKHRHIAEISITGDRLSIIGKEETDDMYSAIDMALDKIDKQIKKSKQKQWSRRQSRNRESAENAGLSGLAETREPRVRVQQIEYKPMDEEEALLQLELVQDNFIVFTNSRTNRVNVIYRRADGDYGLIQPNR